MGQPIPVEQVVCPGCGQNDAEWVATGPDYEDNCCGDQVFTLVQCRRCQTFYLNPRPTHESLPVIYPPNEYGAYTWNNPIVQWARQNRDRGKVGQTLAALNKPVVQITALDIGTGDGALLESFHRQGVPREQLYGLEIDEGLVKRLNEAGFKGVLGLGEDLGSFGDGMFDVVAMTQVIEHVADPLHVMREIYRILRPGGVFLIETPNMDCWDRQIRWFKPRTWGSYHFPRHWTLWTTKTIHTPLEAAGFEMVHVSTFVAAITLLWSINHTLQDKKAPGWLLRFFQLNNPFALAFFGMIDTIPARMGRSANMRVIARRPA